MAEVLDEGKTTGQNIGRTEVLTARHRIHALLHPAGTRLMVALQTIVQVFGAPMLDARQDDAQRGRGIFRLVGDHPVWGTSVSCSARSKKTCAAAVFRRVLT